MLTGRPCDASRPPRYVWLLTDCCGVISVGINRYPRRLLIALKGGLLNTKGVGRDMITAFLKGVPSMNRITVSCYLV